MILRPTRAALIVSLAFAIVAMLAGIAASQALPSRTLTITLGQPFAIPFQGVGGKSCPIFGSELPTSVSCTVEGGVLPAGVAVDGTLEPFAHCTISGVLGEPGTFSFTIRQVTSFDRCDDDIVLHPIVINSLQAVTMVIDEDTIGSGTKSIEDISFSPSLPRCGGGNPSVCVNDDIAEKGVRTVLFSRPTDITPFTPFSGLVLPTGEVGDEGLFKFTNPDPQSSEQDDSIAFTLQEFIFAAGDAADENNLDKINGVVPLSEADIVALVGQTVCAVVYDSDVSADVPAGFASLKGARWG